MGSPADHVPVARVSMARQHLACRAPDDFLHTTLPLIPAPLAVPNDPVFMYPDGLLPSIDAVVIPSTKIITTDPAVAVVIFMPTHAAPDPDKEGLPK